jgi:uncharacterized protein (TIGR00266 family)
MQSTLEGNLAQTALLTLNAGENCWAGRGTLLSLDPDLEWKTRIPGGVSGSARRMLSGEGLGLTYLTATRDNQQVRLSANQPGKIIEWNLDDGAVLTTRGSFLAAFGPDIDIDVIVVRRAGAALFGGAGIFLQKLSGSGTALIHGAGDFIPVTLGQQESLVVSTGSLAAFSEQMDYDIQTVSGLRRILFGGEGLFMTRLTGPGRVLLQSLKRNAVQKSAQNN